MIRDNVLIGKNDVLFLYQGGQEQFNYLLGTKTVNKHSIENYKDNMISRVSYSEANSIKYLHIIFPSKPIIYNDCLPENFSSIYSLYLKYYKNDRFQDNVIYPYIELQNQSKKTFLKHDTHNNDYGYLMITNHIIKSLGYNICKIKYSIKNKQYLGDLATMLGGNPIDEEFMLPINKAKIFDNFDYIKGNTNNITLTFNKDAYYSKRVLIFGDSFIKGTLKFLSLYFKDILYCRSQFFHQDIIQNYQPDIVLSAQAERYLSHIRSDLDANNFLFTLYGDKKYYPDKYFLRAFKANIGFKHYPKDYIKWENSLTINFKFEYNMLKNMSINWDAFYTDNNLKNTLEDPIEYYIKNWRYEDLKINSIFSTKIYLQKHKDIRENEMNPLIHFYQYGLQEGRKAWD